MVVTGRWQRTYCTTQGKTLELLNSSASTSSHFETDPASTRQNQSNLARSEETLSPLVQNDSTFLDTIEVLVKQTGAVELENSRVFVLTVIKDIVHNKMSSE